MIRISKEQIGRAIKNGTRPDYYFEEICELSSKENDEYVYLSKKNYRKLRAKYTGRSKTKCKHAEFKLKRPCCGDKFFCHNPESPYNTLVVKGTECKKCNYYDEERT